MVVAVISVDAYPFSASSHLTCHLEDTGIGVFWFHFRVRIWKQKTFRINNPTAARKIEQKKKKLKLCSKTTSYHRN